MAVAVQVVGKETELGTVPEAGPGMQHLQSSWDRPAGQSGTACHLVEKSLLERLSLTLIHCRLT